jgi:hypothetical protein
MFRVFSPMGNIEITKETKEFSVDIIIIKVEKGTGRTN